MARNWPVWLRLVELPLTACSRTRWWRALSIFVSGGIELPRQTPSADQNERSAQLLANYRQPLHLRHGSTLVVLPVELLVVSIGKLEIGAVALTAAVLLSIFPPSAMKKRRWRTVPWGTILMVLGMTCLAGIRERTGGLDLFTWLIEMLSTQQCAPLAIWPYTGILSAYSVPSGVVLAKALPHDLAQAHLQALGRRPRWYWPTASMWARIWPMSRHCRRSVSSVSSMPSMTWIRCIASTFCAKSGDGRGWCNLLPGRVRVFALRFVTAG